MSKTKPINLNLRGVEIVNDKEKRNESSKSVNDKKQSTTEKSNKSNFTNHNNQNKSNDQTNSSKNQSNSTSDPPTKKLKVPFEVKPVAKPEPKYSPNNQNLRLLNQADNSRQNLLNNKINKVEPNKQTDKQERALDRSNLKPIATVGRVTTINNNQSDQKKQPSIKPANNKNTDKLANFYLKILPVPFEDDDSSVINKLSKKNEKPTKPLINQSQPFNNNNQSVNQPGSQSVNKPIEKSDDKSVDKSVDKPVDDSFSSNLCKQFLNNEKKRLEVEQLIDIKIKNEYEKHQMKNTVDRLMKALITYKQSTYTPQLVEELNTGLDDLGNKQVQDQ